jgi:hypothetical protein
MLCAIKSNQLRLFVMGNYTSSRLLSMQCLGLLFYPIGLDSNHRSQNCTTQETGGISPFLTITSKEQLVRQDAHYKLELQILTHFALNNSSTKKFLIRYSIKRLCSLFYQAHQVSRTVRWMCQIQCLQNSLPTT